MLLEAQPIITEAQPIITRTPFGQPNVETQQGSFIVWLLEQIGKGIIYLFDVITPYLSWGVTIFICCCIVIYAVSFSKKVIQWASIVFVCYILLEGVINAW